MAHELQIERERVYLGSCWAKTRL